MKKSKSSNIPILIVLSMIVLGSYWATENVDTVTKWLNSVKISSFSSAFAVNQDVPSGKNSSETNSTKAEKTSTVPKSKGVADTESKRSWSEEEIRVFSKLDERRRELDSREQELAKLEEELQKQKLELDSKLKELEKMRQGIAQVLKDRITVDSEKVDKLVEFYANMKPQNAAKIFEEINENLAVEVLGRLKKKNAAEIMNLVKPDKAQRLSEKYAGYRR